jgi:hypothetical protein
MRTSLIAILFLSTILTKTAYTDDISRQPKLGEWGYRHHELHEYNIPQKMGGKACCSGIDSGECRATLINETLRKVYINGHWCTIPPTKTIQQLILPNDIEAVVCAASGTYSEEMSSNCPAMYCVATNPSFVENTK